MLVPIIFIVAFVTALTGALLETRLFGAKIALHDAVASYSDVSIADGVADFTHALATFVARHGAGGPWPRQTVRSAAKSACGASGSASLCPFRYIISATITNASSASANDSAAGDAALNLQTVIDEQRVSAIVTTTVIASSGAPLGTRTRFLTYRVFDTAPYAVISGSRDIATVNGTRSAAQGDSGGAATDASSASGGSAADDTRIHVRLTCSTVIKNVVPFVNDQQVAGNDGLPWGNTPQAAYETPCTSGDVPVDVFGNERWVNGDANASGWTQ